MSEYIIHNGELYHHGVKGMKWGVRRAKVEYREAKRNYREANRKRQWGLGLEGIKKAEDNQKAATKAHTNMELARAKYKAAKANTSEKAEKAEFKSHVRTIRKHGLPGSDRDRDKKSTDMYNRLKTQRGKKYADQVLKKAEKQLYVQLASTAVVGVGLMVAGSILQNNY